MLSHAEEQAVAWAAKYPHLVAIGTKLVRDFNRNHGSVRVDDSLCKERVQVRETLQQCAVG